MEAIANGTLDKIEWIYLSGEIDRISKEFKYAAFFMAHDHNERSYTHRGEIYGMDDEYLQGKKLHKLDNGESELVPVSARHEELLKVIYTNRIVPLFGVFDQYGQQISTGKITFIEDLENPTGIRNYLIHKAESEGEFVKVHYYTVDDNGTTHQRERIIGYNANDPDKDVYIILDHVRKMRSERGFKMKENIDKMLEYSTWIRNICKYTFLIIGHSNRSLANVDRLKFAGEYVYPTGDDVKDSGNMSEECTITMTLFNPNDEKYNIKKHFGVELKDYPNYRSIHIVEARNVPCPVHIQTNMYGGINLFTPLNNY